MTSFIQEHTTKALIVSELAKHQEKRIENKHIEKTGQYDLEKMNDTMAIEGHLFKGILK